MILPINFAFQKLMVLEIAKCHIQHSTAVLVTRSEPGHTCYQTRLSGLRRLLRFERLSGHSVTPVAADNKMHSAYWVRVFISSRTAIL